MNLSTNTNSLSADAIRDKILASKGSFVKASWKSNPKPAALYKEVLLEKRTVGVVRAGVDYANLSAVKTAIENGERGEVEPLPWGEWKTDPKTGLSMFPYVIEHKGQDYIRLYPSGGNGHTPKSTFFAGGVEVTKEEFSKFLTPSEAKKLLNPEEVPLCFTIKSDNILGLPEDVEE